jgi:hypothetical protein
MKEAGYSIKQGKHLAFKNKQQKRFIRLRSLGEEIFEKAQAILNKRGAKRRGVQNGKREKYSRKYAFSSMLECASCGSNLSRLNGCIGNNLSHYCCNGCWKLIRLLES